MFASPGNPGCTMFNGGRRARETKCRNLNQDFDNNAPPPNHVITSNLRTFSGAACLPSELRSTDTTATTSAHSSDDDADHHVYSTANGDYAKGDDCMQPVSVYIHRCRFVWWAALINSNSKLILNINLVDSNFAQANSEFFACIAVRTFDCSNRYAVLL